MSYSVCGIRPVNEHGTETRADKRPSRVDTVKTERFSGVCRGRQGLPREAARRMKVLAFRPRRPSRAEILSLVRDASCGPALAWIKRRAIPAGSRAKVGAAAEAIPPATQGNAWPCRYRTPGDPNDAPAVRSRSIIARKGARVRWATRTRSE